MSTVIAAIHRFPVKGLSADPLERVRLSAGEGLPEDRRFAICHGASLFDPRAPAWQPKRQFLMLALNERLAALRSRFDPATGLLEISRGGKPVARGVITTPLGRDL